MIYQKDFLNCGEACTRNVISRLCKSNSAYLYLSDCTTFTSIKNNLIKFGIESEGYEYHHIEDVKKIKGKKIFLINKNERSHFVNYLWQTKHLVAYFDPEDGKKIVKKDEFGRKSTNKILNCSKTNKVKVEKIIFLRVSEVTTLSIFASLEGALLLLSLYFITLLNRLDLSILCVLCLFILSFVNQSYTLTLLKRLETRIGYSYIQDLNSIKAFSDISAFETSIIKYYSSSVNGVASLIVILFIFFYINPLDIFVILISVFLNFILYLLIKKIKTKINSKMELIEKNIFNCKKKSYPTYEEYVSNGEQYGKLILIEIYIRICIIICLTILEQYLIGDFSFSVIIAKGIMVYYLNSKIFEYIDNFKKTNPYLELLKLDAKIYKNMDIIKF